MSFAQKVDALRAFFVVPDDAPLPVQAIQMMNSCVCLMCVCLCLGLRKPDHMLCASVSLGV